MTFLCVLAVVFVNVSAAKGQATEVQFPVMQFNICGNVCYSGGTGWASTVAATMDSRDVMGASLEEVCKTQFDKIKSTLTPKGYDGYFATTLTNAACGTYGIAIFWKSSENDFAGAYSVPLEYDGNEPRRLACVRLNYQGALPWWLCVTHLTLSASTRQLQIGDVTQNMSVNFNQGAPSLLGGDFNNLPYMSGTDQYLDPLFHFGYGADFNDHWQSGGSFMEATGCCTQRLLHQFVSTHSAGKIDYIFMDYRLTPRGVTLLTVGGDHKAEIGQVLFYG